VRTNVVCCPAAALPGDVVGRLRNKGVLAGMIDSRTVRFMTHKDVDDDDIERAVGTLKEISSGG
jgi:threonine aldolase